MLRELVSFHATLNLISQTKVMTVAAIDEDSYFVKFFRMIQESANPAFKKRIFHNCFFVNIGSRHFQIFYVLKLIIDS